MFWLYYLIPIGIHVLFFPFLCFAENSSTISMIEMATGTIFIPIYLIFISEKLLSGLNIIKCITILLLMLLITVTGIFVSYLNWGILTGYLFKPDSITVLLIKYQVIISSVIITLGWIVVCLAKIKIKDSQGDGKSCGRV